MGLWRVLKWRYKLFCYLQRSVELKQENCVYVSLKNMYHKGWCFAWIISSWKIHNCPSVKYIRTIQIFLLNAWIKQTFCSFSNSFYCRKIWIYWDDMLVFWIYDIDWSKKKNHNQILKNHTAIEYNNMNTFPSMVRSEQRWLLDFGKWDKLHNLISLVYE